MKKGKLQINKYVSKYVCMVIVLIISTVYFLVPKQVIKIADIITDTRYTNPIVQPLNINNINIITTKYEKGV